MTRLAVLCLALALGAFRGTVAAQGVGSQEAPVGFDDLAEAGRWDEVMDLAEQRLAEEPQGVMALAWAGRASYEKALVLSRGDGFSRDLGRALLDRAVDLLTRAVSAGSEDLPGAAREWWYAARLEAGDDATLATDLERAWEQDGLAYAAFLRGWMAWEAVLDLERGAGLPRVPEGEALTWLRRASDAEPDRVRFALVLAEALAASGDRAGAAAAWERALQASADVETLLGTLLSIYPGRDNAGARLERLQQLVLEGNDQRPSLAWAEAHALDQLGRGEEAERAFARVRDADGRSPEFDRAHARLLIRLDRHAEALALMQPRAEARDWEAFSVLLDIADDLGLARRWDESLAAYDAAFAIEHRDERCARNRAITLWRAGRVDLAEAAWADLIALLPGRADILNDAALAAAGAGEPEEERRLLERGCALPGSEDSRENLAAWHLEHPSGDAAEAVRLLDDVLAVEPDRDRALYLRFRARRPQ